MGRMLKMGIEAGQFRKYVVRPALQGMGGWTKEVEELMMGTAAIESSMGRYLRQFGNEYARGPFQIEPPTFNWLAYEWLPKRPDLYSKIIKVSGVDSLKLDYLDFNLIFNTCMARCKYLSVKPVIPEGLHAQAKYWKKYYNGNSPNGRTVDDYIAIYHQFVLPS